MPIISIKDLHKSYGAEVIFDKLSLTLYRKEKVGLIGANGTGKTTLFKLFAGMENYDEGQLIKSKSLRIGYLPQEPMFDGLKTVIEEVHQGLELILKLQARINELHHKIAAETGVELERSMKEYDRLCHEFEIAGGYDYESTVHSILAGVGLDQNFYDIKTSDLSGGQKSRLGLAKVLLEKTDMLLLDEPTNHLDLAGCQWLEKFIRNYEGAAVIVSHDRYLLDKIAEKIIVLKNKGVRVYKGNYSTYIETKDNIDLQQSRELEKKTDFVTHELDFIARNKNKEGMRGTALGRKKRLERLLKENPDYLKKAETESQVRFSFGDLKKQSRQVLTCENLSMAYGDLVLFKGLNLELQAGDRLGITGPNGTGKSTLLKLALGHIQPTAGTIRMGKTLDIGYLDQQARELDRQCTVLEEVMKVVPENSDKTSLRSRLGAFLFTGNDVFKKVGELSGGQQNRLILCKLVLKNPEVLVLDEPTNHLDIQTREVLENTLEDYSGTIIVVSHDRFFLDRIANQLLIIGADAFGNKCMGNFELITGSYSQYSELLLERQAAKQQQSEKAKKSAKDNVKQKEPKRSAPDDIKKFNKLKVEQIELEIGKLENRMTRLQDDFGREENYRDARKLADLHKQIDNTQAEIDLLYRAYEWKMGS